jgi:hypothetical protein
MMRARDDERRRSLASIISSSQHRFVREAPAHQSTEAMNPSSNRIWEEAAILPVERLEHSDDEDIHNMNFDADDESSENESNQDDDEDEDTLMDEEEEESIEGDAEHEEVEPRALLIQQLLRIARNDPTLTEADDWSEIAVDIYRQWRGSNALLLGNALKGNTHLQSLSIRKNAYFIRRMEFAIVQALCEGIGQSRLRSLRLSYVCRQLDERNLIELGNLSTLRCFALVEIPIDVHAFVQYILKASTPMRSFDAPRPLTHLTLSKCFSGDSEMMLLSSSLSLNPCLLSLDLSKNIITNVGIDYFCRSWRDDSQLQELLLSSNAIGAVGARMLMMATTQHAALCKLMLNGNFNIGYPGLEWIGEQLPRVGLLHLDISLCVIPRTNKHTSAACSAACRSMANGLRNNNSLVSLSVGSNSLGSNGPHLLLQAIEHRPLMQKISFVGDYTIGLAGYKLIGAQLPYTTLTELNLNCSFFSIKPADEAGQALLHGVAQNETLTTFSFPALPRVWMDPIQFFMKLNATCRPLLRRHDVGPAVWPHILARFHCNNECSFSYF